MNQRRMLAVVIAAAVAATVLGSAVAAFAAKSTTATSSTTSTAAATRPPGGPGGGRGGGGPGHRGGMFGVGLTQVVAKLTGESTTTITTARQSGRSFSAIAAAKGVSVTRIVELASHAPEAAMDSQVADGLITRAAAETALADLKTRLTEAVKSTAVGGPGGRGHGGPRDGAPPAGP